MDSAVEAAEGDRLCIGEGSLHLAEGATGGGGEKCRRDRADEMDSSGVDVNDRLVLPPELFGVEVASTMESRLANPSGFVER